jgi:hypothetical protein
MKNVIDALDASVCHIQVSEYPDEKDELVLL